MVDIRIPVSGHSASAELPPPPIGTMVVALLDLLDPARELPQPVLVSVYEQGQISLQMASEQASYAAIFYWGLCFGGVLTSEPHFDEDGLQTLRSLKFDYFGIAVDVYAFIPAGPTGS